MVEVVFAHLTLAEMDRSKFSRIGNLKSIYAISAKPTRRSSYAIRLFPDWLHRAGVSDNHGTFLSGL
jgi:hypothetical protein